MLVFIKCACVNVCRLQLLSIIWPCSMAKEGSIKKQSLCAREHWRSGKRYGLTVKAQKKT